MTISMQQLGGLGACSLIKFFRIRCSEIASEAIFVPSYYSDEKMAVLGLITWGVVLRAPASFVLAHLTNIRQRHSLILSSLASRCGLEDDKATLPLH